MASDERGGKRDNRRSNHNRSPKPYGGTKRSNLLERHAEFDENARGFALKRFTTNPLPMAIPKDLGEINDFEFTWSNSPVPLMTEGKIAKMVVRRGEFGWLSNQRVDEIAKEVGNARASNMVVLGAIAPLANFPLEALKAYVTKRFTRGRPGDEQIVEANSKALDRGAELREDCSA
jgi:Pyruvate/2-oxoacid:ferredoxin oxidoreductase gamma subunit